MGSVFLYMHVNIYLCVEYRKSDLIFLTNTINVLSGFFCSFVFLIIVDRAKHTLVMSFGLFSTLFFKVNSISLPAGKNA